MRLFLAIILPWAAFFTIGKPIAAVVCFILQITLIGWLPAAIWAAMSVSNWKTEKTMRAVLSEHQRP